MRRGLPFFRRVAFELLALAVRILPIGDIRKKLGRGDTVEILTAGRKLLDSRRSLIRFGGPSQIHSGLGSRGPREA